MNKITDHDAATLLGNFPDSPSPLLICFHGSGDSCKSWVPLAEELCKSYRVLLWDRQQQNIQHSMAVDEMLGYLDTARLAPPYVLIAHSYGGTFARLFLQKRVKDVAGMVLVETGQETELGDGIEQRQYEKQILGSRPLVVIRGNTLIGKWKEYDKAFAAAGLEDAAKSSLLAQKQLLEATDQEDERLKKAQLALSSRHRYIHLPDCGHNVIQARPEAVVDAVNWVMENLDLAGRDTGTRQTISTWLRALRRRG